MLYTLVSIVGLVAQWIRARGYELRGRGFESLLAQLQILIKTDNNINIAKI